MPSLDILKRDRTSAKRAVSVAANRLEHGVELQMDSAKEMASKLDTAYCDFLDISADYRAECEQQAASDTYLVVNGLNQNEYGADVKRVYFDSISVYRNMSLPANNLNLSPAVSNSNGGQVPMYIQKHDIPKFSGLRKD